MLNRQPKEHVNIKTGMPKDLISFSIKLFITSAILYLVLSSVRIKDYQQALVILSAKPLAAILLLVILQVCLLANRWYLLAKSAGSRLSKSKSIYGILISFFFSQGLPASIGGDAFRIWWHKREGIATGPALNIIFMDRIYGLFSLVVLCVFSLILMVYYLGGSLKIISLVLLILLTGCFLGSMLMPYRVGLTARLNRLTIHLPKNIGKVLQWVSELRNILSQQNQSMAVVLMLLGILTHALVVLEFFVIGHSLVPDKISLLMCFAAVPPALLISYMPFSIAGWGVREASMVVAFGLFGIHSSVAILISLIIGMAILFVSLLGGVVWIAGGFRSLYAKTADI